MAYPRPEIGVCVVCAVCGMAKKPHGRSAPLAMANGLCDDDCSGYRQEPRVGDLWPGEMRAHCDRCGGGFPFHDRMDCGGTFVDPAEPPE